MTKPDPLATVKKDAVRSLQQVTKQIEKNEKKRIDLINYRKSLIEWAIKLKIPKTVIGRACGVSHTRIAQILEDK